MTLHEDLGEVLGAFELRGGLRRAEDAQAGGAELVDDAGGERSFRSYDRKGDVVALNEFDQLVDIGDRKVFKTRRQCRAGIAGNHENWSRDRSERGARRGRVHARRCQHREGSF